MLPDRKAIRDLFEGLLGRAVDLDDGRPVDLGIPKPLVASYVDDAEQLRAVAVMSFGLAARSGAAIALIPQGAVEAAEEDRILPGSLFDNASEICHILAAPLGDALGMHLRLASTFSPAEPVPAHVLALAAQAGAREDVELDITGYGSGELSLVVTG